MKKKEAKKNQFSNFLRKTALVEAVVVIILIAIAFSTKNVFLFRVLLYIGLFLKFIGIMNPNPLGDIPSALLLLAIFITLISGIPAADSLNKSIEALEGLPKFIETQTEIMNKSMVILEGLPDFMQAQTAAINKSIETLEEIHDFLIKPVPE
ncbi:hypothetical protein ES705_26283 [subsurface metagenome]